MLKFSDFGWGYLSSNGSGGTNEQTDLHGFYNLSSSIDKVSLKKKQHVSGSCSFGEVVYADVYADTDATE